MFLNHIFYFTFKQLCQRMSDISRKTVHITGMAFQRDENYIQSLQKYLTISYTFLECQLQLKYISTYNVIRTDTRNRLVRIMT